MKTLRLVRLTLIVALCTGFYSCSESDEESNEGIIAKVVFNGCVQKGPFINGSSVTITQLDNELNQTGKVYSTKIADNIGNFEERNIDFTSPFVELKANGYYFNEVEGELSNAPITLYALADVSDANSVNINILTHLEYPRLEYLIKEKGMSFIDAKQQARKEVLNVFGVSLTSNKSLEQLNLTNDAILVVVSSIIQGYSKTGEVSELLAAISSDIRIDGQLNNSALGSQLANNIAYLNIGKVQTNLMKKYSELGTDYSIIINDLNKYVQDFKANTNYQQTEFISYPSEGKYGVNILADGVTIANTGYYSMKANVPDGAKLKILVKGTENKIHLCPISFVQGTEENWFITPYDSIVGGNVITVIKGGQPNDLEVSPSGFSNTMFIEYYEYGATEPTKTKKVQVKYDLP